MKHKQINVDKLREIRERLPYGAGKEIQRRTGLGATSVSYALNGKGRSKRTNPKVLEAAYAIIEEEAQRAEAQEIIHSKIIK